MWRFFLCFICLFASIYSYEDLSFARLKRAEDLSNYEGQHIRLTGYLYETPTGEWVLAEQPNLKSCCVGSLSKIHDQIYLDVDSVPPGHNKLVMAEGVFHKEGLKNRAGDYIRLYSMKYVRFENPKANRFPTWTVSILGAVFLFALISFLKKGNLFNRT